MEFMEIPSSASEEYEFPCANCDDSKGGAPSTRASSVVAKREEALLEEIADFIVDLVADRGIVGCFDAQKVFDDIEAVLYCNHGIVIYRPRFCRNIHGDIILANNIEEEIYAKSNFNFLRMCETKLTANRRKDAHGR